MASDYLRWKLATSSFVVGMRQAQPNDFLFPSSEREGDGKISQGKITSKKIKNKKDCFIKKICTKCFPRHHGEIAAAKHSLRNGTELAPAETTKTLRASCKPPSGLTCPHMFDSCSDVAIGMD